VAAFVNLTTWGRYRINFDGRISIELGVADLFWDLSQVYYRFDSDPSLAAAGRDDYGFVTGLRYEFLIPAGLMPRLSRALGREPLVATWVRPYAIMHQ